MRPGRIIHDELHDMRQLSCFIGKALHDVFDQHAHDLLSFSVLSFH